MSVVHRPRLVAAGDGVLAVFPPFPVAAVEVGEVDGWVLVDMDGGRWGMVFETVGGPVGVMAVNLISALEVEVAPVPGGPGVEAVELTALGAAAGEA